MDNIHEALTVLETFERQGLTQRIANLEYLMAMKNGSALNKVLEQENVTPELLKAAFTVKKAASQIDVVVHAAGIMVALPYILKEGEIVESLALGAGNTGRKFDLETNFRVAEFKFINWQGGSESIRQNQLFKDLFGLAVDSSGKEKYLYLVGKDIPMKFLTNSRRSLASVLSKNIEMRNSFYKTYGDKYQYVSQYFRDIENQIRVIDLKDLVPALQDIG